MLYTASRKPTLQKILCILNFVMTFNFYIYKILACQNFIYIKNYCQPKFYLLLSPPLARFSCLSSYCHVLRMVVMCPSIRPAIQFHAQRQVAQKHLLYRLFVTTYNILFLQIYIMSYYIYFFKILSATIQRTITS